MEKFFCYVIGNFIVHKQDIIQNFFSRRLMFRDLDSRSTYDSSTSCFYSFPPWKKRDVASHKAMFLHRLAVSGLSRLASGSVATDFSSGLST